MPTFNGKCHCGQVTWTAEIPEATHILWYDPITAQPSPTQLVH